MAQLPSVDDLYSPVIDLSRNPRADSESPANGLMQMRAGGLINFIGQKPTYMDPTLKQPAMDLMTRLNQRLYDYFGIALPYGCLKIKKDRLPTCVVDSDIKGGFVWKRILGEYNPNTMEITIDDRLNHGEVMRVLGHELVHYAQHLLGGINRYMKKYGEKGREYIEEQADYVNDGLLGDKYHANRNRVKKALAYA